MIFNLLGTPTDADVDMLEREDAKKYMRCFAKRPGEGLRSKFPAPDDDSIDIMDQMLRFNPQSRVKVADAVEHRLFNDVRDKATETAAPEFIHLPFELEPDLDETLLRKYFCKEI